MKDNVLFYNSSIQPQWPTLLLWFDTTVYMNTTLNIIEWVMYGMDTLGSMSHKIVVSFISCCHLLLGSSDFLDFLWVFLLNSIYIYEVFNKSKKKKCNRRQMQKDLISNLKKQKTIEHLTATMIKADIDASTREKLTYWMLLCCLWHLQSPSYRIACTSCCALLLLTLEWRWQGFTSM